MELEASWIGSATKLPSLHRIEFERMNQARHKQDRDRDVRIFGWLTLVVSGSCQHGLARPRAALGRACLPG